MITGPQDTPYANGCFLFDVYLPSEYPNVPPKVNLMTTGRGSVRFNPNLYDNGYVCLSLLGTWDGGAGESWDSSRSSLLQLAVSIQSLIMVPMPYFNEPGIPQSVTMAMYGGVVLYHVTLVLSSPPGYESQELDANNVYESNSYNDNIEEQTIRWAMLDILKTPPVGFERIVRSHFFLRQVRIYQSIVDLRWCMLLLSR